MPDSNLSQLPLDELLRRLGIGNMGLLNSGSPQSFGPVLGNASAGMLMPGQQRAPYGVMSPYGLGYIGLEGDGPMVRAPQSGIGHDANNSQPNDLMIYDWLKRFGALQERA